MPNIVSHYGNANWNHPRYHFTPIRTAIKKKLYILKNKCWWGSGKTGTLVHCWQQCKTVQLLWKTVWWFLKKLNIEWPYDQQFPLLDVSSRAESRDLNGNQCTRVHSITHNSQRAQTACPSADGYDVSIQWISLKWTDSGYGADAPWKTLCHVKKGTKRLIPYDSTYRKYVG